MFYMLVIWGFTRVYTVFLKLVGISFVMGNKSVIIEISSLHVLCLFYVENISLIKKVSSLHVLCFALRNQFNTRNQQFILFPFVLL